VLYTCNVTVSGSGAVGVSGVVLGRPDGGIVPGAAGRDGVVCVGDHGAACALPRPAPTGPAVYVEDLNLPVPGDATIAVRLATGGSEVVGAQNDLAFPSSVRVKTRSNGTPDCSVNRQINKLATSFAFRTVGCPEGSTCVRAVVVSAENVQPIADGSVLYTCNVTVSGSGAVGVSGVVLGQPDGGIVPGAAARDGVVCVGDHGAACALPRPAPTGPAVYVEDLNLPVPGDATIAVRLTTGSSEVAAVQNDLFFPASVQVRTRSNGRPDCAVNRQINKPATSFAYRVADCPSGYTCVRALVVSTENVQPIPDGSVLYTCNVTVSGGGTIFVTTPILARPDGTRVEPAVGRFGEVCVGSLPPTPVAQLTPTRTFTPLSTPTRTRTRTPTATPSRTSTPTPTRTRTPTFTPTRTRTPTHTATATPTPLPAACPGDCDGNREVTIDELVLAVRIALEEATLGLCPSVDDDGDGRVTIDELVLALNMALSGCRSR